MTPHERTRLAALVAVSAVSALSLTLTFIAGHAGASAPMGAGKDAVRINPLEASAAQEGTLSAGDPAAPVPGSSALDVGAVSSPAGPIAGSAGGPLTFRAMVPSDWLEIQGELAYEHALAIAAQQGQWLPDDDPKVVQARAILAKLEPFAMKWNDRAKGWKWELSVIHSPDLDAVCLPGGKVLINDGLIDRLGLNENETALLIAHLIAHALREHARSKIGEQIGRNEGGAAGNGVAVAADGAEPPAASSSLLGSQGLAQADTRPSTVGTGANRNASASATDSARRAVPGTPIVGAPGAAPVNGLALAGTNLNVVSALLNLRYEAADETEADVIGADMASRAGFDPRAGLSLWEKVDTMARWKPTLPFVLEHPISEKRLADLKKRQKDMLPLYARSLDLTVDDLPPYKPGRWNPPRLQRARDDDAESTAPQREVRKKEPEHTTPLSFLSSLPHRLAELFK
ncbi:M48 family metalloprotease [Robbsia sp. KACC 23696]|uniref:M48 family metalloprotease n=1 Tax=Robbsia sp. KACC 23696 TaxID=3149231 RepID=UPI00325BCA09